MAAEPHPSAGYGSGASLTADPPTAVEFVLTGLIGALFARSITVPLTPTERSLIRDAVAAVPNLGAAIDAVVQEVPDGR